MSRYAMEWAKLEQPGDSAAKSLLLVLADHSDGPTHVSSFVIERLQYLAGLQEEAFQQALAVLMDQKRVEIRKMDGESKGRWREGSFSLAIPDRWSPPNAVRRPRASDEIDGPRFVYRLYDAQGLLLYVGIARWPEKRLEQHSRKQSWWHCVVTRELMWYENLHLAAAEEYRAIQCERPIHNIMLVPRVEDTKPPRRRYRR